MRTGLFFFFQAEDGIRDLVRSRGLGDVYKRQTLNAAPYYKWSRRRPIPVSPSTKTTSTISLAFCTCLLYTSDAADERSSVDLGGRRIIKKKNKVKDGGASIITKKQNDTTIHTEKQQNTTP